MGDIETADMLMEKFCKIVESLCGWSYCTINMHLHLHIKEPFLVMVLHMQHDVSPLNTKTIFWNQHQQITNQLKPNS